MKRIRRKMEELRTNEATIRAIIYYLANWLYNRKLESIYNLIPDASSTLKKAIEEQEEIGWDHFIKGRISQTWSCLYQYDIETKEHNQKYVTVEKWDKEIVRIGWDFVLEAWSHRNNIEHDNEGDPKTRKKEKIIGKILWKIKNAKVKLPYKYNKIDEDSLKKCPIANLEMLIEQIQMCINGKG
jgi:hypothetical protein